MPVGKPNSFLSDTELLDLENYHLVERFTPLLNKRVRKLRKLLPIITKCDFSAVKPNTSMVSPNGAVRISSKDRGLFCTFELYLHNRKAFACCSFILRLLRSALNEATGAEWRFVRAGYSENTYRYFEVRAKSDSGANAHFDFREYAKLIMYLHERGEGVKPSVCPKLVERKQPKSRSSKMCVAPKMAVMANEMLDYLYKEYIVPNRGLLDD